MAREARKISKSGNYYVILRGEELFVANADKQKFIEILEKNFATGIVHGTELTKTEFRLVVKEGEKGISMTMKPVTTSYARYFNRIHGREGKLFKGRFQSEPLETNAQIEECLKNLKTEGASRKPAQKASSAPSAARKRQKPVQKPKEEKVTGQRNNTAQKNLPSWLL